MSRISRAAVFAVAALLPFSLGACFAVDANQRHGEVTLNIGHSPSEMATRRVIEQCAQAAVAYATREGAVLYVAPVGATADIYWTKVDFHLRGAKQETNHDVAREVDNRHAAEAWQAIDGILNGPMPHDSSDQINSLAQAGRVLAHATGPRVAVICADGHTVSPELNIYRQPLNPTGIRRAIGAVRGELVSMRDVDVVWGDAGGDRKAYLSGAREAQIARFWTVAWARAVHAQSVSFQQTAELPAAG
jgi:hypothetical protein